MPTTALGRATAARARHWLNTPVADPLPTEHSTSAAVRAAVQQAMADHLCDHYTRRPGIAPLCKAVAAGMKSRGLDLDADNGVVITGGVAEARYVALHSLAPGKDVYVAQPGPGYHQPILDLAGITAQPLDPKGDLPDAQGGLLLLDPTALDGDTQAQLAEWAVAHDITVIADETGAPLLDGAGDYKPFAAQPGMAERTLTLGAFNSAPGLESWQVAWFAGPKKLAVTVRDLKQAMTICSPAPAQYAALAALTQTKEAS
jgi:aspartate/methionine/tyrosine aminotransferase